MFLYMHLSIKILERSKIEVILILENIFYTYPHKAKRSALRNQTEQIRQTTLLSIYRKSLDNQLFIIFNL